MPSLTTPPQVAADDRAGDCAGDAAPWYGACLARLRGAVPQRDVADLVGHDARGFAFGLGRLDHAAVDEHRSAGQREGVDVAHVDDLEGVAELVVPKLGRNRGDQAAAEILDIGRHLSFAHQRQLLPSFARGFPPQLDVLLDLVLVFRRRDPRLGRRD